MAESSAETRTEQPTPRRIARARREGEVAMSRDLVAGLAFASACAVLILGGNAWVGGLAAYLRMALADAAGGRTISKSLGMALHAGLWALGPALVAATATAILAGLAQSRGLFATARLRADARRLRPRLGRLLGREQAIEVVADLFKFAVLCGVAYWSLRPFLLAVVALPGASPAQVSSAAGALLRRLGSHLAITMVGLGVADYLWQLRRYRTKMRMTRDQARREQRESEGDPEHKAERRRLYRLMQMERAADQVGTVSMVLLDPGHTTVTLSYLEGAGGAPLLVARARTLRGSGPQGAVGRAELPSFVEPGLVRALASVEEGDEIPEALYASVARLIVKAAGMHRLAGAASSPGAPVRVAAAATGELTE